MSSLNSVFISGRIVSEPRIKEFEGGGKLVEVRLASHRSYKKGDEWQEKTTFVDCEAGGYLAERMASSVEKGSLITVSATLDMDEWETDGQKRTKLKLRVNDFEVNIPRYKKEEQGQGTDNAKPAPKTSQGQRGGFRGRNQGNQAEIATGVPF